MDAKINGRQQKSIAIKQIMSQSQKVSIQNPKWQEKSWEIRKLANILQWHKNDPHTHNKEGEEVLPEACSYRKINDKICITSIKQLEARQITLSPIEYKQLVDLVKETFTQEINQ